MLDWVHRCREILFRAGIADQGWGYRLGATPAVESTVLSCLALLASDPVPPEGRTRRTVEGAAVWLARLQQDNGALAAAPGVPGGAGWPTCYAMLLWAAVGGHDTQLRKATDWLLLTGGATYPKRPEDPAGHNTELVGWPWVQNTHSWLEPTAVAVMTLRRLGHGDHPRVQEGLAVIRDRAVPTGGWNYGNTSVLGNVLRAHPGPTAHALLALAGLPDSGNIIDPAVEYLLGVLPETRAPRSLGWGLAALTAWDRRPPEGDRWLEEAYRTLVDRREPPYLLSMLVLAATAQAALPLMGLTSPAASAMP